MVTNYVNNLREGNFLEYHPNGKIAKKGFFIKGEEHGKWEEFNEKGKLIAKCTYQYGDRVQDWEFFKP